MAKSPIIVVQKEAASRSVFDWTPELIRAAELNADAGSLRLAADLCETMMADDRVSRCLGTIGGLTHLPLEFEPPEGGSPSKDPVCRALEEDWWKFMPEAEERALIGWGVMLGVGLAHIEDWSRDRDKGRVLPLTETWHPRALRCDSTTGRWYVTLSDSQETGAIDRFWLFRPYGTRRSVMRAPWRGLARICLLKKFAYDDWARYSERHGEGTDVLTEGADPNAKEVTDTQRLELASQLRALARSAALVLPAGFDYKHVEATANTWRTFQAQIDMANSAISVNLCGGNLTSEVQGGSLAAATVHGQVEGRVLQTIASALSTDEHNGLLVPYTRYNFGDAHKAPYPKRDAEPPADMAARADVLVKVSTYVNNMVQSGYTPDAAQIEEEFSLRLLPGSKPEQSKQPGKAEKPDEAPTQEEPEESEQPEEPEESQGDEAGESKKAEAHGVLRPFALAASLPAPLAEGQGYVDRACESAVEAGIEGLHPTIAALLDAIHGARDYSEAFALVKQAYRDVDSPVGLAQLTENACVMASLGGQLSVHDELANG